MLLAILLATAATQAPIHVAPADPTALYKGDGGALKFDPACRDYTLDNVQSNQACAALVARGEAAPSLAIAMTTLRLSPSRATDAVQLLKRSATTTNSPAVHYARGSVLGTAERVQPDYVSAIEHLNVAAERGNPAAADLLASLLIAGKGTSRNVARAIQLYEKAAANGFPDAALSLGKLYLAGKYVKKDEERGLAWLDAAAAVNVDQAAQLATLARNQAQITNLQLIPSADPAKVQVRKYGTFDNPTIPPSFGFDPEFQAIYDAPYDDPAVLDRLETGAASLPTPYLYERSRRLAARDPNRSFQTYLLARTRMTYDISRCSDSAGTNALQAWDMIVSPDILFLFTAGRPSRAVVENALAEEAKLPADNQPWWVCRSGASAISAAMSGEVGALQLKPSDSWPELRNSARAKLNGLAETQQGHPSPKPQ